MINYNISFILSLRYFATQFEIQQMEETVIFVGARRYPVDDYFLEDLPSSFPEAFDDDDALAVLRNCCIFNKKPMSYYLDMDNSVCVLLPRHGQFGTCLTAWTWTIWLFQQKTADTSPRKKSEQRRN